MATSKYLLAEEVSILLKGGDASASTSVEIPVIIKMIEQLANQYLKIDYFNVQSPAGETIPDALVLANYERIIVEKYKSVLSRAKLPAQPISLPRGMGVYFVGPYVSNLNLAGNSLTPVVAGTTQINLTWTAIPNATSYYLERATDAAFTANLTPLYSGSLLGLSDTGLTANTNYWYRVLGRATGYNDSVFTVATATTAAIYSRIFDQTFDFTFQ